MESISWSDCNAADGAFAEIRQLWKTRRMTVYVDDAVTWWRGQRWAHLMADTLDELHAMAARLGMPRRAFQDKTSGAHYDVDRGTARTGVAAGRGGDLPPHRPRTGPRGDPQRQGASHTSVGGPWPTIPPPDCVDFERNGRLKLHRMNIAANESMAMVGQGPPYVARLGQRRPSLDIASRRGRCRASRKPSPASV